MIFPFESCVNFPSSALEPSFNSTFPSCEATWVRVSLGIELAPCLVLVLSPIPERVAKYFLVGIIQMGLYGTNRDYSEDTKFV
ncbi:hypothetical protein RJT34_31191 [Clitoria ternatea]|uniref:Uncharacterized protein n=1 Tax=Clitoria ternatea TaxID=43366 RepID=A0AAN9EV22_CLITE